ncbi:MAG: hypothetical protein AB4038_03350 [Prochloraceae cyanobacterium]
MGEIEQTKAFIRLCDSLHELRIAIENLTPKEDKAFEIFKIVMPELRGDYDELPVSEFNESVRETVQFSVIVARLFEHYVNTEDLTPDSLGAQIPLGPEDT